MSFIFWVIGSLGLTGTLLFAGVLVPMVLFGKATRLALWIGMALLAVLVGGAVWSGWQDLRSLQAKLDTTQRSLEDMRGQRDAALGSAKACSDSVQALADASQTRAAAAAPVRQQAAQKAQMHEQKATVILAAPPAVKNDDAASAHKRIDDWLRSRGQ